MKSADFPEYILPPELTKRGLDVLVIGGGTMEEIVQIPYWPSSGGQGNIPILKHTLTAGGCGTNVAVFVGRLGGQSAIITRLGSGRYGEDVVKELIRSEVNTGYVHRMQGVEGNYIIILTNQEGDWTVLASYHPNLNLELKDLPDEDVFRNAKLFHIDGFTCHSQDERNTVMKAIDIAHHAGVLVSSDGTVPSAQDQPEFLRSIFRKSDIVFANLFEAMTITNAKNQSDAIDKLQKFGPSLCVLKLGPNGSYYITPNCIGHIPAFEIDVIDTVAAGDALIGTVLFSLSQNLSLYEAALRGSAAGALACLGAGSLSSFFRLNEIDTLIARGISKNSLSKEKRSS